MNEITDLWQVAAKWGVHIVTCLLQAITEGPKT